MLALMAGVTSDPAQHRFTFLRLVIREELLVDHPGHLEHSPGRQLQRLLLAREIAPDVAGIAVHAQRLGDVVHFFLELLGIEPGQHLDGWAFDDLWLRWLCLRAARKHQNDECKSENAGEFHGREDIRLGAKLARFSDAVLYFQSSREPGTPYLGSIAS